MTTEYPQFRIEHSGRHSEMRPEGLARVACNECGWQSVWLFPSELGRVMEVAAADHHGPHQPAQRMK